MTVAPRPGRAALARAALARAALLTCAAVLACGPTDPDPAAPDMPLVTETARSGKVLGPEICAFGQAFTLESTNPYYPLEVGRSWLLEGDDEGTPLRVRIDVLDRTEDVGGVETRVLVETEWELDDESGEYDLLEVSHNYFAETLDGTVCYFGEAVEIYEDGEPISNAGEWRADEPGHAPGIFMPADPRPGMRYRMEVAPGIAEDEGRIVAIGPVRVPAGLFTATIRVREYNPLDEDKGYKVFAAGVGTIVDGPIELVAY
jgi:hypothetical protein